MGIQTHFDKFHQKIKMGRQDDAYKKARDRDDSITGEIKEAFKEAKYPVTSDFIQGSLATSTAIIAISGDSDVDRALVIDGEDAPGNPVDVKKKALSVLEDRGFRNAKIKKPCVTADYASEAVHIDFPIYKKSGGKLYLAVGKKNSDEANREWALSDPRGLIDWINDSTALGTSAGDKHEQYRRMVRYLKRWRDVQFSEEVGAKVYSIGLTIMAKSQFSPSLSDEGFRNDLIALRKTVEQILNGPYFIWSSEDTYKVNVSLPVEPWRDVFDGSSTDTATQLRNKLTNLKDKLIDAEALDDERKQCLILNKLFGSDFVVPEPPKKTAKNIAVYSTSGSAGTSQGA